MDPIAIIAIISHIHIFYQSVMIDVTIMENVKETEVAIVFLAGTENFALFPVVQIIVSIEACAN